MERVLGSNDLRIMNAWPGLGLGVFVQSSKDIMLLLAFDENAWGDIPFGGLFAASGERIPGM
jgi:hypothetical protein